MAEEVGIAIIIHGGAGERGQESDGTSEKNHPEPLISFLGSSSDASAAGPSHFRDGKRGRYAEQQEQEERVSTGSGATEALSEMLIPVGQASKKFDSHHRHQFVAHEALRRIPGGRDGEFRHCDISGHEHSQCFACHKVEDQNLHHYGDNNRLFVGRSVKKALRVIAPPGTTEGWQASSSSTKGEPLLLSTAPAGAMDGLQQAAAPRVGGHLNAESSDWAPSPKYPNASYSDEKRNRFGRTSLERHRRSPRRSRQKVKNVDPDSDGNSETPVMENPSYSSGLALDATFSSRIPQTSLSSIARARSKETSHELRSYRRVSELPYAVECTICQTEENQLPAQLPSLEFKKRDEEQQGGNQALDKQEAGIVQSGVSVRKRFPGAEKNTREAATDAQTKGHDDNKMKQVHALKESVDEILGISSFTKFHFPTTREEKKISAAAAGKKRESELVESQLRRELHAAQEKLRGTQEQDQQEMDLIVDLQTVQQKAQVGQNFGDLQTECEYLRKELKHMKKHFDILNEQNELFSNRSVSSSEQLVDSSRLESAQKLVTDLRSTLEESQKRLLQLEESHEKHEGELQTKLIAIQDREAKLVKELQTVQEKEIRGPNVLDPHGGLMQITAQLHTTTKLLESLQIEYESLRAAQEQCEALQKQVERLYSELENQKELTQQWEEDCEVKEENLRSKDQKLAEMEKELHSREQATFRLTRDVKVHQESLSSKDEKLGEMEKELHSREQTTSQLTRDLKVHRESLSSKDLVLSTLEKKHQMSQESLLAKELRLSELEKMLQHAQEELESRELVVSGLEKQLLEHREHLSSKELLAENLDKDLQQHRQSLLVKDQTIVEMEKSLQVHRLSMFQTEKNAKNLLKDLEQTQVQLREGLEKCEVLEKQMNDVVEKDIVRFDQVKGELDVTKEQLNDVLARLEAKTLEQIEYRRRSVQALQEAQEQTRAVSAELDAKAQEESRLRKMSVQSLQESQEQLRVLQAQLEEEKTQRLKAAQAMDDAQEKVHSFQTQLAAKIEEEKSLRSKSAQDLEDAKEKMLAVQTRLDSKIDEEKTLRIKSAQDLQEAQEKMNALKELQVQNDGKYEEEKNLRRKSVQDLQVSQEKLRALQDHLDEKAEEERNLKANSAQELQYAQEQLNALKELQAQIEGKAEEETNRRRKAEQDFKNAQEQLQSLQAEMKREIAKELNLRRNSLMEFQQIQEQLNEMKELKSQLEGNVEEQHKFRRKSEQDLDEAQQQLLSEREHMMRKDEEDKHFRRKSIQDLQDTQEKLRSMQYEHRRQSIATTEKVNLLLTQRRDLVEKLETVHDERKLLESDHEQALLELEMIRKVFAGLKVTLAKHDLCIDFVEDVQKVLRDLHTMIDDHTRKQQNRRDEYFEPPDQGIRSSKFSPKRGSAGKVLRDLHSMIDDQNKQRRSRRDDYTEHSDQGFIKPRSRGKDYPEYSNHVLNSRISKISSSVKGDTSSPVRVRSNLWQENRSMGIGNDGLTDGNPENEASGGEELRDEEDPMNHNELKEELEEKIEDALSTLGVQRNSVKLSDDMYEKLVTRRFQRRPSSDGDDVMDTLNTFKDP